MTFDVSLNTASGAVYVHIQCTFSKISFQIRTHSTRYFSDKVVHFSNNYILDRYEKFEIAFGIVLVNSLILFQNEFSTKNRDSPKSGGTEKLQN